MAKNFGNINTARVYNNMSNALSEQEAPEVQETQEVQEKQKGRKTYTPEEIAEAREAGKTSGKKDMDSLRINMAFRPSNYEYIKTMSKISGMTMTNFVNNVIAKDMKANAESYEKAQAIKYENL